MTKIPKGPETITDPITGEVKLKGVTQFGTPPVQASLKSASDYTKRTLEKQAAIAAAKQRQVPVGGAPPIPEGKLAPIAHAASIAQGLPQPAHAAELQRPTDEQAAAFNAPPRPQPPKEAPEPPKGVGAGLAEAHIASSAKRPITLQQAKEVAAGNLQGAPPGTLTPETQQLLNMQHQNVQEAPEAAPEQAAEKPPQPELPARKEELDDAEDQLIGVDQNLDPVSFDFDAVRQTELENDLWNETRRAEIEKRLAPLNFADMITKRSIEQEIIVIPGQFHCGFRTLNGLENQYCQQFIFDRAEGASTAYIQDLLGMCRLTCSLISINGALLPDHRKEIGQYNESPDDDAFSKKLNTILHYPMVLIADLGVQQTWFTSRCARLFTVGQLKNG